MWKEVSYEKALDKVMHRLREKDNATISTTTISSATNNVDLAAAAEANHVGGSSQLAQQPDVINSDQSDDFDTLLERIVDPMRRTSLESPRLCIVLLCEFKCGQLKSG